MKSLITLLVVVGAICSVSCGNYSSERQVATPQGSDSNMPWNTPNQGEGQGAFGGAFSR